MNFKVRTLKLFIQVMDVWKADVRHCSTEFRKRTIEHMESKLEQYKGGEVVLEKAYWDDGIAIVYLNHPEKKNAMSGKMMVDLRRCVTELESFKEGKAVILTSKGENFCSGGDLDFVRASGTAKQGFYMCTIMHNILKRFRKLPLVSVSLVHGPTLGGGAELSLYTDFILAADNAKIGFVEGKLGIITPWGGTTRLVQLLGERKALDVLLSSKIYNAQEGLELGLIDKVVSTEKRLDEALQFIKRLMVHDHSIIGAYKSISSSYNETEFCQSLKRERELFFPMWGGKLNKEALQKALKHIERKEIK